MEGQKRMGLKQILRGRVFRAQDGKRENFRRFQESLKKPTPDIRNKPLQLFLEVTNQCNLRCQKCGRTFDPKRQRTQRLPFSILSALHPYYSAAIEVNTFGYGEMFLYEELKPLIEILKTHGCKLCGITNGTMIAQEDVVWLVSKRYDELTFSIDGADPQTMKRLRGADLNQILTTLEEIKGEKERQRSVVPRIIINFVAQKDNFHELPDLIRKVSDRNVFLLGVNALHYFPAEGPEDSYSRFYHEYSLANVRRDEFERVLDESRKLAEEAGIHFYNYVHLDAEWQRGTETRNDSPTVSSNIPKDSQLSPFYCLYPWTTLYLAADLSTKVCCFMEQNIGRVLRAEDLDSIWQGKGMFSEIRNSIRKGLIHPACKVCVMQGHYKESDSFVKTIRGHLHL